MAVTLDPKYICSSDLESIFLDKLTGLPLANGYVNFYINNSGTPKDVYILTGSPPSSFVSIGSTVTLDSIGQYSDGANSVAIYYYPYDETGALELYQCEVFSSDNIPQFTRELWPPLASNIGGGGNASDGVENYIPNGQFLSHNDNPISDTTTESGLTIREIAQGGWSFKQTTTGSGTYTITFNTEPSPPSPLVDFPPFSVNIVKTGNDTSPIRDLVIQWPDVDVFSKNVISPSTNKFNLFLAAQLNAGSTQDFDIRLIRNFGTGGSAATDVSIGTLTVTDVYSYFNQSFDMPDNSGLTVGANSFIAISIRMPATDNVDARFTDFALTLGESSLTNFPFTPNATTLSKGVAGWMPTPNPDGSDLYLPLRLTQKGMEFDHTVIGSLLTTFANTAPAGYLAMDGLPYSFTGYNLTTGIPYSRLGAFLTGIIDYYIATPGNQIFGNAVYPAGIDIPLFGSGVTFVNAYGVVAQPTRFLLHINAGAGVATIPAVGTAPLTLSVSADPSFTFTVNSVPTANQYFTFTAPVVAPVSYYVWFRVNSSGTDPSPGGTGIVCDIASSDTTAQVAIKIMSAINQYMFATFNIAGFFLRQFDSTGLRDTGYNSRLLSGILGSGDFVGTSEVAAFLQHTHTVTPIGNADAGGGIGHLQQDATNNNQTSTTFNTGNASVGGGTETRPVNFAVNYFIRY